VSEFTHECAVPHCTRQIPQEMLMCFTHWKKVSKPTQRRVYRAWNRGNMTDDYCNARAHAIGEVCTKMGLLTDAR